MKDLNAVGNLHMEDCGVQPAHGCGCMSGPVGLVFITWGRRESLLSSLPEQSKHINPNLGFLSSEEEDPSTGSRSGSAVGKVFPVGHIK